MAKQLAITTMQLCSQHFASWLAIATLQLTVQKSMSLKFKKPYRLDFMGILTTPLFTLRFTLSVNDLLWLTVHQVAARNAVHFIEVQPPKLLYTMATYTQLATLKITCMCINRNRFSEMSGHYGNLYNNTHNNASVTKAKPYTFAAWFYSQ